MGKLKKRTDLIASLLNKNSQPDTVPASIVLRDARELVPNPKNKSYSMENIEELAAMIQMTHNIETVKVRELPDGRFMILSGHRRCAAQIYRFEHGMTDAPLVPTQVQVLINDFEDAHITEDEIETLNVIFPNKGTRRNLTPSEEAAEIALIKPIIRKLYEHQKETGGIEGKFRAFFAGILGISETSLVRKEAINKLTETAKTAVDEGKITPTAAAELAGLVETEQDEVLKNLEKQDKEPTVNAILEEKNRRKIEKQTVQNETQEPLDIEPEGEDSAERSPVNHMEQSPSGKQPEEFLVEDSDAKLWILENLGNLRENAMQMLNVFQFGGDPETSSKWRLRLAAISSLIEMCEGKKVDVS